MWVAEELVCELRNESVSFSEKHLVIRNNKKFIMRVAYRKLIDNEFCNPRLN